MTKLCPCCSRPYPEDKSIPKGSDSHKYCRRCGYPTAPNVLSEKGLCEICTNSLTNARSKLYL